MLDTESAQQLMDKYLTAWEQRDVDALVALLADDVSFSSTTAAQAGVGEAGLVRGKEAIRAWFASAMAQLPPLTVKPVAPPLFGVDTLVVSYEAHIEGAPPLPLVDVLTVADDGSITSLTNHSPGTLDLHA